MLKLMVKMVKFRMGQKVAKGTAKKIGLKPAWLIGVIGGLKAL